MRKIIILFFLTIISASLSAQQLKTNAAYQEYIEKYKGIAIEQMKEHGIPASITLAQGLLESGAGRSSLAVNGNNHFGIKCHDWTGRKMYKDDDRRNDCFRVYNSARDSYEDHSAFLKRSRYQRLYALNIRDYKGWAHGLKACGYATNPRYAQHLIEIIELYQLYVYDDGSTHHNRKVPSNKYQPVNPTTTTADHEYVITYNNKNYYVIARAGDTFKSIAPHVGVSYSKLARYNERNKRDVLTAGERVYLKKKRSKADKKYKKKYHVIQAGESIYTIAQYYGITLKAIYKKNGLTPDYTPRVGDKLIVY